MFPSWEKTRSVSCSYYLHKVNFHGKISAWSELLHPTSLSSRAPHSAAVAEEGRVPGLQLGFPQHPENQEVNKGFAQVLALCLLEPPSPVSPRYFCFKSAVLYLQGEPSPGDPGRAKWFSQSSGMGTAQFKCIQSCQNPPPFFFFFFPQCVYHKSSRIFPAVCWLNRDLSSPASEPGAIGNKQPLPMATRLNACAPGQREDSSEQTRGWASARESSQDDAKSLEGKQKNKQKGNTAKYRQLWGDRQRAAAPLPFPPCPCLWYTPHTPWPPELCPALLFNALFITFLHSNKADTTEAQLHSRSSPKYFHRASLFRERLGQTRTQLAECCWIAVSKMCCHIWDWEQILQNVCWLPGSSTGLAHWARLCQCPEGTNLFCNLPAGLGHLASQAMLVQTLQEPEASHASASTPLLSWHAPGPAPPSHAGTGSAIQPYPVKVRRCCLAGAAQRG